MIAMVSSKIWAHLRGHILLFDQPALRFDASAGFRLLLTAGCADGARSPGSRSRMSSILLARCTESLHSAEPSHVRRDAIFAIGLFFGILFHRSGNLWIVAILHGIGNAYIVTSLGSAR